MADFKCGIVIPEASPKQPLTVGYKFFLNCEGVVPSIFEFKKAQLTTNRDLKYFLQLVKVESFSENNFSLQVVSYQAGQVLEGVVQLTDGQNQIDMALPAYKIETVLTQEQQKLLQEGKPVPPYGFVLSKLDWPIWPTAVVLGFVVLIVLVSGLVTRHYRRIKKLFDGIKQYDSAISPDSQFYRTIRNLEKNKKLDPSNLSLALKIYLARRFQIPFVELSNDKAIKFFNKKWPLFKTQAGKIARRLKDLETIQSQDAKVAAEQIALYLTKTYRLIDECESLPLEDTHYTDLESDLS